MNFALVGVGGYIAPRHMQAIKETGHTLTVALDGNDSVGVIDGYFPEASFFTEFERFDRHVEKLRRGPAENRIHYVTVCSPNYLHDAHTRFALRVHADVICEKPLVLEPWNVDALQELERESGQRIWCILQLRLHPHLVALREQIAASGDRVHEVDLTYITSRGRWYAVSWKGVEEKSGGIAMNIGIHFFDLLLWVFGSVRRSTVHFLDQTKGSGYLELERARVRWFLSVDAADLPPEAVAKGARTHRSLLLNGEEYEFSEGFKDLHVQSYRLILDGKGFGAADVRPTIQLVHDIRSAVKSGHKGEVHPLATGKRAALR